MERTLLFVVLGVNLVTFLLFGLDKWLAGSERRRVPEAHLLWLTALSGALGAWIAMSVFRHKTRKKGFRRWALLATAVNGVWIWLWLR